MRRHKRGIVLISILVLTLLITFFLGALLQMSPTRLRRTVHDERHDLARAAARAGIEYALTQLSEDLDWRGAGDGLTVQTEALVVREDRGNVYGWVRHSEGEWAGFRFRFNYQDGPDGADGLDQPRQLLLSPAISLNNLRGSSPQGIPLGTGPEAAFEGQRGFMVPENSVALVVEGFVGDGVAPDGAAGSAEPRTEVPGRGERVVRSVEGIYQVSGFAQSLPQGAVLQAGGDSSFILGSGPSQPTTEVGSLDGLLRLSAADQTAVMRTKGESHLGQAPGRTAAVNFFPDMHSEVRVGQGGFSVKAQAGQEFTVGTEGAQEALMDIAWAEVSQSDQADRLRLPAGVYAVAAGDSDSLDLGRVRYFPMTFAEYRTHLVAGTTPPSAPVPQAFLDCVQLNGKEWTAPDGAVEKRDLIVFDRDVEVTEAGGVQDLAIVPLRGAREKAISDSTVPVTPSTFMALSPEVHVDAGSAIMTYLHQTVQSTGHTGDFSFSVDGRSHTYRPAEGSLSGGTFGDLALAVVQGKRLTFVSGLLPSQGLPGAPLSPSTGGGSFESDSTTGGTATIGTTRKGPIVEQTNSGGMTLNNTGPDFEYGTTGGGGSGAAGGGAGSVHLTVNDLGSFLSAVNEANPLPPGVLEIDADPNAVPASVGEEDKTVPQDIEIAFQPGEGKSAAIRTSGNVLLGTHISGEGGAVVAGGRIDVVGLGIDLHAGQGERDGISLYAQKDIRISTYDARRNRYWDASIKGVIFTRQNLMVRLGEILPSTSTNPPTWGTFDFMGSAIVLGTAPPFVVRPQWAGGTLNGAVVLPPVGNAAFVAQGMRFFYEPKFLAPYVESDRLLPKFRAVSLVER